MSEDQKGESYSFDVCSRCKHTCCKDANPPLTFKRTEKLSAYIEEKNIPINNIFVWAEYSHPTSDADGICAFYNKLTQKCCVHPVKPETCKAGPITFDINLETQQIEFYLKKGETCTFAQVLSENKELLGKHLEVAKTEILKLVSELEANALKSILRIPEPQTFKIDQIGLPTEVILKLGIFITDT